MKNQLITEGNEINPDGELAKIINRIQIQSNTNVIDIDDLNAEIKQNKFTFQFGSAISAGQLIFT